MRRHWALAPDILHLNHGSFGATPRAVLDVQRRIRDEFESNPTGFVDERYLDRLDEVRTVLASFVSVDPASLAFVTNATSGVASVVGSIDMGPGDEILTTDHTYNACRNTIDVAATRAGATVTIAPVRFPDSSPDQAVESVLSRVTAHTRLAVVDHVTSPTALVLDVERIVAELEPDVPVLVDGAHAPGMLPLDLGTLGASYYTGNLHKWVCAPKGAGFLAVAERHRQTIRPTVISHGWNTPDGDRSLFHRLFDWTGTFDPSAWLSVPSALETMAGLHPDGWPGVMAANRALTLQARDLLSSRLSTPASAPDGMTGSMAAFRMRDARPGLAGRLRSKGIIVPVSPWPDPSSQVLRISAQMYNTIDEYDRLADAILAD
ncbi:MAG: aminotransferase class V-fold PLP-dependent enzyme [Acidimicrobiia bacterium]